MGSSFRKIEPDLIRDQNPLLLFLLGLGRLRLEKILEEGGRERGVVKLDVDLGDGKVVGCGSLEEEDEEKMKDLERGEGGSRSEPSSRLLAFRRPKPRM